MSKVFSRPIPGQSLTSTPKNAPYENPPEITDPEEALEVHLIKLTDKKRMSAALDLLETGIDLQTLVEGILRSAVINGIHSIDVSLLIAPVIHEYIKLTADEVGIEYSEGFGDEEEEEKEKTRTYAVASERARKTLKQMDMMPEEGPVEKNLIEDEMPEEDFAEDTMEESKPKGLMAKENM